MTEGSLGGQTVLLYGFLAETGRESEGAVAKITHKVI